MFETTDYIKERAEKGDKDAELFLEYIESLAKDWAESLPMLKDYQKGETHGTI